MQSKVHNSLSSNKAYQLPIWKQISEKCPPDNLVNVIRVLRQFNKYSYTVSGSHLNKYIFKCAATVSKATEKAFPVKGVLTFWTENTVYLLSCQHEKHYIAAYNKPVKDKFFIILTLWDSAKGREAVIFSLKFWQGECIVLCRWTSAACDHFASSAFR